MQRKLSDNTALPASPHLPAPIQAASLAKTRRCLLGSTLSSPAPPQESAKADLAAALAEPSPQSPWQTRPCSTTSLRGLQQQASPRLQRRRWGRQRAGTTRPALSGQLTVSTCHHMDIYRNAASGEIQAAPLHFLSSVSKQKPPPQPGHCLLQPGAAGSAESKLR